MMADMYAKDVTILVITYERALFIRRLVGALNHQKFGGQIIISDSSSPATFDATRSYLSDLSPEFTVVHISVPKRPDMFFTQSMNEAIASGVKHIHTKYAMLTCDDDYPVPSTLERCAEKLDKNHYIESVIGDYVNLYLDSDNNLKRNAKVTLEPSIPILQENAAERYRFYVNHVFHTMFCVTRSKNLTDIIPSVSKRISDPHFSSDFIWMFKLAICGQLDLVSGPQIIRQRHAENLNAKNVVPSLLDTIMSPEWTKDSSLFVDHIATLIGNVDGISQVDAQEAAFSGFLEFLRHRIQTDSKMWWNKSEGRRHRTRNYRRRWSMEKRMYDSAATALMEFEI